MKILYPTLTLVSILLIFTQCSQDVQIPNGQYGFSVGDPFGTLRIQFFVDFQCPDSKQAYNTWISLRKSLSLFQNHIQLTYQFNPLPYHFYAFKVHQAFFYVLQQAGQTTAEDFIDYIFKQQDSHTQEEYLDKTGAQFQQEFASQIASKFKLSENGLLEALNTGSPQFQKARNHWKYTVGVYGVAGAPLFYANGVRIDGSENYSYADWIDFIKKYKYQSNQMLIINNLRPQQI